MRNLVRTLLCVAALAALSIALSGCPNRDVSAVNPDQSKQQTTYVPITVNRDIDILWIVDNSGSMIQEQTALAQNFPRFIDVLDSIEGGRPNLHMAIVSSDVGLGQYGVSGTQCDSTGDDGKFQLGTGCPALTDGNNFIVDTDDGNGGRNTNYTGTLQDQFSCMAQIGTNGCGFEEHLKSMKMGLDSADGMAFLRKDAYLAVISIQDEDDGSAKDNKVFDNSQRSLTDPLGQYSSFRQFEFGVACDDEPNIRQTGAKTNCHPRTDSPYIEDVKTYADYLKGLKDDPAKVIVATITGPATPDVVADQPYGPDDPDGNPPIWIAPSCVVCPGGSTDPTACSLDPHDTDPSTLALTAAAPSVRMQAFINEFPGRGTFQNICNYNASTGQLDFTPALQQIASLLKKIVGSPCVEGDLQLGSDGQPICEVADVANLGTDNETQTKIDKCNASMSNTPCWHFISDPTKCNASTEPTHLELVIERGGTAPPPETTEVAKCLGK